MAVLHDLSESFIFLPILVAFLILGLVIAIVSVIRRQQRIRRNERLSDTFLPPFVGGKIPKEETYVVPRDWKPSMNNRVYAPLSIPIEEPRSSSSQKFVQSIIHVLPPRSSDFV
ncbi:uncharacterized protein LOC110852086 [Folsomia candida]|uniref:Uncharacterized protein n=1 Tax=Folsomia candida TaxID=158441 RepID=A0A226E1M1_FOLCA|nr:uncharacterized protein LOC110852086 [Folsomia candida]OXA51433.1 hypothetical protein Fcan01_12987 [Folsomia candida]